MRKEYLVVPAALSVAMLVFWTGCASKEQPQAAGDGGTNLAYMAEGTPAVTSTRGAEPSATAAGLPSAAPRTAPQESFQYTVQPGDSLWKIANKHGTSVSLIQKMNNMPPDKITIRVGDKITIPGKADADRLRQQAPAASGTGAATTVPTVTVPTTTATRAATPSVTTTRTTLPSATLSPAPTVTTPAPTATAPAATVGSASWLPPSYRTPQAGAATTPGVSTTTPSLTIAPGSATLSPGAVKTNATSAPPASLTLPPATINTPVGGMTIQAVGPSGAAPAPAQPAAPAPNP